MKRIYHKVAAVIVFVILITVVVPYLVFSRFSSRSVHEEFREQALSSVNDLIDYVESNNRPLEDLERIYRGNFIRVYVTGDISGLTLNSEQRRALEKDREMILTRPHPSAQGDPLIAAMRYKGRYIVWQINFSSMFSRLRRAASLSLLVSLVIGSSIALFASSRMTRPIRELDAATQKVAAGDFSIRLPEKGRDEVSSLVRSFNTMTRELGSVELLRSDFVSDISHEFKTPLTAIEGYAKLLESDCSPQERKEYVQVIIEEARRLSTLSENILMLNRIEKGNLTAEKRMVSLDEQIRRALTLCERKWEEKEIDLELELDEVELSGFEGMLMQVWTNLIDNAVKFSPQRGRIDIRLVKEQGKIRFTIADQGDGVPAEKLSHIFEKFYKADSSRGGEGNGLGLSIVKQVVELHGGTIRVESVPDGTVFTVLL